MPFAFRPLCGSSSLLNLAQDISQFELLSVDRAFVYDHDAKAMYFIGNFPDRSEFDSWHHAALLRLALVGGEASSYELTNLRYLCRALCYRQQGGLSGENRESERAHRSW